MGKHSDEEQVRRLHAVTDDPGQDSIDDEFVDDVLDDGIDYLDPDWDPRTNDEDMVPQPPVVGMGHRRGGKTIVADDVDDGYEWVHRRRGIMARGRARFQRTWERWMAAIPEDDEGPEKLPKLLQGTHGRVIIMFCILGIVCAWGGLFYGIVL